MTFHQWKEEVDFCINLVNNAQSAGFARIWFGDGDLTQYLKNRYEQARREGYDEFAKSIADLLARWIGDKNG